jgi:RHS repeat-associated protein
VQGEGFRVEKFLWHGEREVGSVDGNSKCLSLRVLGEGLGGEIGAAVLFEKDGEVFIPLHDLSGDVRACLNTNGDVVEKLDYTAFGLQSRTADITPWTFSSKRQDEGTGFLYFGRRYYESSTATWLTQDPLGHSAGPNLYAYVKNNPLTCIDLYGLLDASSDSSSNEKHRNGKSNYSYVISGKGIWRSDQLGQENVPHIELSHHTWEEFSEEFKDRQCRILEHTNGIRTTCVEVRVRIDRMYNDFSKKYDDTMMCYNPTHGFVFDFLEAVCNILGIKTEVVTMLREQLEYGLDFCKEHDVTVKVDPTGHSQGAGINKEMLSADEFGKRGDYYNNIGKSGTFGGVVIDPKAENYIQQGDIVPSLNPGNWGKFDDDNVHEVERTEDSLPEAHDFDGHGYQNALHDFVDHVLEGSQ